MSNLRIVPVNFFDDANFFNISPAFETTLPLSNAQLSDRGAVGRSTSNAPQIIWGNWNQDLRIINSFFMFSHTGLGGKIQLQLFRNHDVTDVVYDSGAVEIQTLVALDLYEPGMAPLGLATNDQLGAEAPYSLFLGANYTCASFALTFTACQHSYWQIARIFMGKYLEAPYNPENGMHFGWASNTEHQRSRGASLRTNAGERWREFTANMFYQTDADRAAWRDVMAQIDSRDFVMSVFPGVGGRQERDHVANMKNAAHAPFAWSNANFNETTLKFAEV